MLSAVAGLLVPLLAMSGADVHYETEDVQLAPDDRCGVEPAMPLLLHFDAQSTCARLVAEVDLPPGTTSATWRFLHQRDATDGTLVVENVHMGGSGHAFAPAEGDLPMQERTERFDVGEGPARARWGWLAIGPENMSADVRLDALRLEAEAADAGMLRVDGGARQWIDGNLMDRGRMVVEVAATPGWEPWLRFQLDEETVATQLIGPDGQDILHAATWDRRTGVLEVPPEAMQGPGVYQLHVRMPGTFAAEAGLAATFMLLIVGVAGGAALAGAVLLRYADGPGRSRTRRVRAMSLMYGLLVTVAVVTLWQTLVGQDARLMLQAPLHPVAATQYMVLMGLAMLFLLMVLAGGADLVRHLSRRIRISQTANQELSEAQHEIQVLTAAAAHDMKSPLRAIYAYADLLQRRPAAGSHEALESIKRSARRMTQGVDALLQFTRVLSTAPDPRQVDVASVVRDVKSEVRDMAAEHGIALEVEGQAVLHADRALVQRALQNLVENAIKYGPRGGTVRVRAADEGDMVRIEVQDEGVPVAEAERGLLFDAFHRGTGAAEVEGSGLGLATVAKVAELHGGEAGLECEGGNRFWFTLPAAGIEVPRLQDGGHPLVPRSDATA